MISLRSRRLGLALVVPLLLAACADSSSLPLTPKDGALLSRAGRGAGLAAEVQAVRRHGRADAATARVLITPEAGGTVSAGGVTLTVPANAVSRPVMVRLTVPNGRFLFARFQPHGLQFSEDATLSFDLSEADADRGGLQGVYVGEGAGVAKGRFAGIESYPVHVEGNVATFDISHFSGYIVASGRSSQQVY